MNSSTETSAAAKQETSAQKVTPFLWFNGNVKEAVDFYTSVFKNSKIISISPLPDGVPGRNDKVISATFEVNGLTLMALDGGPAFSFTPAISFYIHCATQEEVDYYWEKLSAEGEEVQCGWVKDKFGISWQVVPDVLGKLLGSADRVKSGNAMKAMLKMKKLDIAELERAFEGV
jgi:predicted 3-demethylubiquinone-9 3-methyltransferase (glyoxalase superfamily)